MCDPVTAITATTALLSGYQAERNASKQKRAIRKAQDREEEQIRRANSLKADNKAKQARAARSRIRARAAGTGVSGLTVESLIRNQDFQLGTDLATIEGNNRLAVDESQAQEQSRINSVPGADWIGAALQIGRSYENNKPGGANA